MKIEELICELTENDYSIVAVKGEDKYISRDNGIKPVIFMLNKDRDFFRGYTVVDKIIGKASAMLLAYSGAKEVYAPIMSEAAFPVFEKYGVKYSFGTSVRYIINRTGDGMCPMEMTVKDIDDPEQAIEALNRKIRELAEK